MKRFMKKNDSRWSLFTEQEQRLLSYQREINKENYLDILSDMYKYVKSVSSMYHLGDGKMHDFYYLLSDYLISNEEKFTNKKKTLDFSMDLEHYDEDNFFDVLVYKTRQYLIDKCFNEGYRGKVSDINLTNKCVISSKYVRDFCKEDETECYNLEIHPGYDFRALLFNGGGFHFANIVKYNGEYYLVDVTYSQFFYEAQTIIDRLGLVGFAGCSVGTFVLMDEERLKVAKVLLQKGYIKLTDEIFKIYLDPFTISFRNGLYYENTGDFSYTTDYTVEDYFKFLSGEDDQINHEGRKNLGYQKLPLKNSMLDFRKR